MGAPQTLPANFNGWDSTPASGGSTPPATLPANFSGWDDATKPKSTAPPDNRDFATRVGDRLAQTLNPFKLADTISGAIKEVESLKSGDVSTKNFMPNMAKLVSGIRHTYSDPANILSDVGTGMLGGELADVNGAAKVSPGAPKAAAPSTAANILEHPGVSPWVDALKKELMRIPGADLISTVAKSARGFAEGAPDALESATPIPSHPTGPPELWGQRIPEPAVAPQPSAANVPKRGVPIWRDATRQNVPYAGEDEAATQAVIDKAIPPSGDTLALNKRVQAQVNVSLSQGDIASAEKTLDAAAKKASPTYTPPDRPRIVPSVQNIRERIAQTAAAEAQPSRITPDTMDDAAVSQEMNWDLERHGWAAEAEARREFIARNSTGVTKSELTGATEKPVRYTRTPGVTKPGSAEDDLLDKLQTMLETVKKQAKAPGN